MSSVVKKFLVAMLPLLVVLAIYSYPCVKARAELGSRELPPIFAPDLSLYLNLSNAIPSAGNQVQNPYYRIPVPKNGSGYLKFDLAPRLFWNFTAILGHRIWIALFAWNLCWWLLLSGIAALIFYKFLPSPSGSMVVLGVALLMLFNFGVLRSLVSAWLHLPSSSAFAELGLPFMRAFIPVMPAALILSYLGLQIFALRRKGVLPWCGMAALQLLALAIFPYATLIMAGITAVTVLSRAARLLIARPWTTTLLYATACAAMDAGMLSRGSVGFYDDHSRSIHLQLYLLPHLIGTGWLLIACLTAAIAFNKTLKSDLKWPLVGLGVSNAVLMLGDAVVPATKILLSHHAGYFVHTTVATLLAFLLSAIVAGRRKASWIPDAAVAVLLVLVVANGILLTTATYRRCLTANQETVELSNLRHSLNLTEKDLLVASSLEVDDTCGWMALLSYSPELFCTDSEVMLTPKQNVEIHRFRQAIYLYLTGETGNSIAQKLASSPASELYRLGYWAEAVSASKEEREDGLRRAGAELVPPLQKVEDHDVAVADFFRNFSRIVVIDRNTRPTFSAERLSSFFALEAQQTSGSFHVSYYKMP